MSLVSYRFPMADVNRGLFDHLVEMANSVTGMETPSALAISGLAIRSDFSAALPASRLASIHAESWIEALRAVRWIAG